MGDSLEARFLIQGGSLGLEGFYGSCASVAWRFRCGWSASCCEAEPGRCAEPSSSGACDDLRGSLPFGLRQKLVEEETPPELREGDWLEGRETGLEHASDRLHGCSGQALAWPPGGQPRGCCHHSRCSFAAAWDCLFPNSIRKEIPCQAGLRRSAAGMTGGPVSPRRGVGVPWGRKPLVSALTLGLMKRLSRQERPGTYRNKRNYLNFGDATKSVAAILLTSTVGLTSDRSRVWSFQ